MNRSIRMVMLPAAIAAVLLTLLSQPVVAAGPVRQPLPASPGVITGFCTFDINADFPVSREYITTFNDAAGNPVRSLIDGHLVATLTNLRRPDRTLTLNISGPGQIVYNSDQSQTITFKGNSIIFVEQGLLLTSGRVVVNAASPTALGVVVTAAGRQRDLCTMLA